MKNGFYLFLAGTLFAVASMQADAYQCGNIRVTIRNNSVGPYPVVGMLPYDMTVEDNGATVYGFPTTKTDESSYTYTLVSDKTYSLVVNKQNNAASLNKTACN